MRAANISASDSIGLVFKVRAESLPQQQYRTRWPPPVDSVTFRNNSATVLFMRLCVYAHGAVAAYLDVLTVGIPLRKAAQFFISNFQYAPVHNPQTR